MEPGEALIGSLAVTQDNTTAGLGTVFARLWAASTLSALGSGLATVAAPLFVASRTDDPLVVAAASAVAWLPWLLFALPGGVLVDRMDRRRLMIVIDLVRVVALAVLATAIMSGRAGVVLLYVVLFVVNTGEIVFRSASQAMLPTVVPRHRLERANGWLGGGTTLMNGMLAGPLGGFLFALSAGSPFLVNAVTYALSAVLVALIGGDFRAAATDPRVRATRSMRTEIVEGLRWLAHQRLLRTMAVLIGLLNVTLTAALAVLVLLAAERLRLGSVGYGLLFTCMAVGGVLGALLGDRLIAWISPTWTIRVGLLIEAGLHLALAASRSTIVVGIALFAFGVHSALWNIVANSLRQRLTPPTLQGTGRQYEPLRGGGGNCVGALLGGLLAARFGITAPYWVGLVVAIGVSAATWRVFDRATVARAYADPPPVEQRPTPVP